MSIYQRAQALIIEKIKTFFTYSRKLVHTYKQQAVIASLSCLILLFGVGIGHAYYQANIDTVYHVYWQGEKIGSVNDPQVIETWVNKKIEEESSKFNHVHMLVDEQLSFETEEGYKLAFNNRETLNKLQAEFDLQASAVKVVIDGEFLGYAPDEEILERILQEFKQEYVAEEVLATLDSSKKKTNTVRIATLAEPSINETKAESIDEQLPLNQPVVVEASIKQDIELEPVTVHPRQVLNAQAIRERLSQSKVEEKIYSVQPGDVLGTIAQKHGLKLKELLELNPDITEDTILQIGQEIVVEGLEPYLTVVTTERLKREETIAYGIETKVDPNLYRGDTRVEREGREGKKLVEYKIIKENGKEVVREVIDQEIISEPISKIIVRGDKVKPSRGSGQFAWPAVGGKISSSYGKRWGRMHEGIDISGVRDRTIKAADNGKVTTAGYHRGYGNYVIIDHDNGFQTLYAHLSSISVKEGDVVRKGEKIGVMGSTGRSTGVHLHFEVIKNGRKVNPMNYLSR